MSKCAALLDKCVVYIPVRLSQPLKIIVNACLTFQ